MFFHFELTSLIYFVFSSFFTTHFFGHFLCGRLLLFINNMIFNFYVLVVLDSCWCWTSVSYWLFDTQVEKMYWLVSCCSVFVAACLCFFPLSVSKAAVFSPGLCYSFGMVACWCHYFFQFLLCSCCTCFSVLDIIMWLSMWLFGWYKCWRSSPQASVSIYSPPPRGKKASQRATHHLQLHGRNSQSFSLHSPC